MREIIDHIVIGDPNDQLKIDVLDEPGPGGAYHQYEITWRPKNDIGADCCAIDFQNGTIAENGVNGVTQEALLAIVIDRLRSFQSGPFASEFNAKALRHCEQALAELHQRTKDRIHRGVEGQHSK